MKKYGVRDNRGYRFHADRKWYPECQDSDKLFGTDDLNEAFEFAVGYNSKMHSFIVEIFEKVVAK